MAQAVDPDFGLIIVAAASEQHLLELAPSLHKLDLHAQGFELKFLVASLIYKHSVFKLAAQLLGARGVGAEGHVHFNHFDRWEVHRRGLSLVECERQGVAVVQNGPLKCTREVGLLVVVYL